jgi:hypothetical protein
MIELEAVTVNIYFRFVNCCTNTIFEFRGSIPAFVNNNVYSAAATNILTDNNCYTVTQLNTQDSVFWAALPLISAEVIVNTGTTNCKTADCPSCEEPCGACPEGYLQVGNECVQEEIVPATYTGGLMLLQPGDNVSSYNNFGIRLYDDISTYNLPIIGAGATNATFTVRDTNGTGVVIPQLANIQSTLWGCSTPATCSTFILPSSTYGGRLNKAGLWAPGYPDDTELCFEFCINIVTTKQYIVGIAGDNSVKFYIDGISTVQLNGNGSVTKPFNHWHAFPITLTAGEHTIRLCGINDSGNAAFAAEIYDIDLVTFQATLLDPAVGPGNCGNALIDIDPYIIFSTFDYIGQLIPNPSLPGVWQCPDGSTPDYCTGIPQCIIQEKIPFPICPCYLLIPCDGEYLPVVSNSPELSAYVDDFVSVQTEVGGDYHCVFVVDYIGEEVCETAIIVSIDPEIACPCPPQCYFISNASGVVTVTNNGIVQLTAAETYPYVKICSDTYPLVDNTTDDYLIISLGDCIDGVCPTQCYKLVNCQDDTLVIYTTSDSVLPYLYGTNPVVEIVGRTGCWTVENLDDGEICDCPIDIIITTNYATCQECIGYTSYKLTACIGNDVIYTLDDLSAYLNNTIKIHCGCYTIEKLNILPPNPQTVVVDHVFNTCLECTRTYWKLTDCAGVADDIYTYTDISLYEGSIIKIEGCDTCWEVSITEEPLTASTVNVILDFETCEECNIDIPCQCSTISNLDLVPKTYLYLDCDYNYIEVTVPSGQTSDKVCAIKWIAKGFCDCFIVKLTQTFTPGFPVSLTLIAIANGSELNGYPVYDLCEGPECGTVSFNGTNWVIYDVNGDPFYLLTTQTSTTCPFGNWVGYDGQPIPNTTIESYECNTTCNCINLTIVDPIITNLNFTISYYDDNDNPVYLTQDELWRITFNPETECWELQNDLDTIVAEICNVTCPVGLWSSRLIGRTYTSTNCTVPPIQPELTSTDCIQIYGLCQFGVCPHPEIKNNRTVRPGYNTPGCDPDRYDEITCHFADIMYKIVLEKRYGITNCCPEDDEKWLVLKELIDLQALKDPNYICPDCPCTCNSGKSHSSCNCGN